MRRLHPVRRLSMVALIGAAAIGVVTAAGPAGAAGGTVTCSDVSGNRTSPDLLYSCVPSGTTGGGGSIATPVFSGTRTGTIDWDAETTGTHATTVIHVITHVMAAKASKAVCPAGTRELRVSGSVRSDSSGSVTVGGSVAGTFCREPNGAFALALNTSLVLGG